MPTLLSPLRAPVERARKAARPAAKRVREFSGVLQGRDWLALLLVRALHRFLRRCLRTADKSWMPRPSPFLSRVLARISAGCASTQTVSPLTQLEVSTLA